MAKLKAGLKKKPTKALRDLEKIATNMGGPNSVRIGLPKGTNNYPDGTSTIMVGTVHEFGSPSRGIPQRSYLRSTLVEGKRQYKRTLKNLAGKIVDGKITKTEALNLLGLHVQTDVRDKITDLTTPALKSRDGNPLVDTGHLRQSITFEVE